MKTTKHQQEREGSRLKRDWKREFTFRHIKAYVRRNWWITYAVPLLLFVLFGLILGSSNVFVQLSYSARIRNLENRLEAAEKQFTKDSLYMEARYKSDDYELEEVARGKFLLKEPDEMVFYIVDTTQTVPTQ